MSKIIQRGKELIRISSSQKTKIEYSINSGKSWATRFSGTSHGDFLDLTDNGKEILATTSKGLYYSINEGKSWSRRN